MDCAQNKKIAFYLLLAEAVAVLFFLLSTGRFEVRITNDSAAYLHFFPAASSIPDFFKIIFSNYRTFGYPLFLKLIGFWNPDYAALPVIQYALYAGAVLFFYGSLTAFGFGPWTAWGMSAPLLAGRLALKYSAQIMSDSPALALAILCFAWALRTALKPEKIFLWAALGLTLFFCVQIRPVIVFLALFIPLLIVLLRRLQPREDGGFVKTRGHMQVLGPACIACLGPLLLFCLFRFMLTGERGITSYAGINAAGLSAALVQPETLPKLPPDLAPLALAVLEERSQLSLAGIQGPRVRWKEHERWVSGYNDLLWDAGVKPAERLFGAQAGGARHNLLNERLWAFFQALVYARPLVYAQLYFLSCQRFMMQTLYTHLGLQASLALWFFSLFFAGFFLKNKKGVWTDAQIQSFFSKQAVLGMLSLPFYILQLLLVLMIQIPQGRYYTAAEVFLPGFFLALAILPWEEFGAGEKAKQHA